MIKHHISVKEALGVTYALNHWKHYLIRRKFYVQTDHRNLIPVFEDDRHKGASMPKRQIFATMRHILSQFNFEIAFLPGHQFPLTDYLSRDGSYTMGMDNDPATVTLPSKDKPKLTDEHNHVFTLNDPNDRLYVMTDIIGDNGEPIFDYIPAYKRAKLNHELLCLSRHYVSNITGTHDEDKYHVLQIHTGEHRPEINTLYRKMNRMRENQHNINILLDGLIWNQTIYQ